MKKLNIIFTLLVITQSCLYTKNAAIKKFCQQDTVTLHDTIKFTVTVHDTGENFNFDVNCAALQHQYDSLLAISKKDTAKSLVLVKNNKTYAKLYSDSVVDVYFKPLPNGKTQFLVKPKPRTIQAQVAKPVVIKVPCNCPPLPQPTFWQNAKTVAGNISLYVLLAMVLVIGIKSFINKLAS